MARVVISIMRPSARQQLIAGLFLGPGLCAPFVSEVIWRSGHEKVTSEQKIDQTGSRMAGCMRKLLLLPLHTTTQAPGRWRLHNVLATFLHVARGRSKLLACIHGASLRCGNAIPRDTVPSAWDGIASSCTISLSHVFSACVTAADGVPPIVVTLLQ
uniref:Uncharacterized protein n=2 Tax=Oryza TaxID=4527 RepID=A0A0D9ZDQ8_9ORYZ